MEDSTSTNSQWKTLFRIAAIAAMTIGVIIPVQCVVFALFPPPQTVTGWFTLFRENKFVALLDMDLLMIADYILFLIVFLALWATLKKTNRSLVTIALVFQLVNTITYFSSTAAFEMLHLSDLYVNAANETERIIYFSAGQSIISNWQGTAFDISYIMGCIALLLVSFVMFKSKVFSKTTCYLALIAAILMTVPPTAGMAGIVISLLSLVPTVPWLFLIAGKFRRLSRSTQ